MLCLLTILVGAKYYIFLFIPGCQTFLSYSLGMVHPQRIHFDRETLGGWLVAEERHQSAGFVGS